MSYLDRDYNDRETRGEKFRRVAGRIFGDVENPLGWSFPLFTVAGIRVRIHLLFVVYAIGMMIASLARDNMGVTFTAMAMASLFLIVLLHEFGHCFACRAVDGDADQILMWPLGGLASCAPPDTWQANLVTTAGGPAVNVLIAPITAAGLGFAGYADAIVFNPLAPASAMPAAGGFWIVALWWTHYINLILLGFNVLLPMFPLDGGRIMHAIIWAKSGRRRASEIASMVGLVAACIVGVFAIPAESTLLLAIAIFAGLVCWRERQLLRLHEDPALVGVDTGAAYHAGSHDPDAPPARPSRRERKQVEREQREQEEVDRILAKIGASGMDSLTRSEKRLLKQATKRRRGG